VTAQVASEDVGSTAATAPVATAPSTTAPVATDAPQPKENTPVPEAAPPTASGDSTVENVGQAGDETTAERPDAPLPDAPPALVPVASADRGPAAAKPLNPKNQANQGKTRTKSTAPSAAKARRAPPMGAKAAPPATANNADAGRPAAANAVPRPVFAPTEPSGPAPSAPALDVTTMPRAGSDPVAPLPVTGNEAPRTPAGMPAASHGDAPRTAHAPILVDQVAVRIAQALNQGHHRFTVHLRPPELGAIDVRMETADNGRNHVMIVAERPETLEALQRDQRALERALQQAGLNTEGDGLNFSLRGERDDQPEFAGGDTDADEPGDSFTELTPTDVTELLGARADGVDLKV